MLFTETRLKGAFIIDIESSEDQRGFFARSWCDKEFKDRGLDSRLVQCDISFNNLRGTLRGMHYQIAPCEETKLVRCTMGSVYDVIIDLRSESLTYKQWMGIELTSANRRAIFIPPGFAHGFQSLVDNAEVFYQMSEYYHPEYARGVRWNDPVFGIEWPVSTKIISPRDQGFPDLNV